MKNIIKLTIAALLIAAPLAKGMDNSTLNIKLFKAVVSNNFPSVKKCLMKGANASFIISSPSCTSSTSCMKIACAYGYTQIVKLLLNYGADPSLRDTTPEKSNDLLIAASGGYTEIVKLILNHDITIIDTATDNNNITSLMYASASGNDEMVELLLGRGANPHMRDTTSQRTNALLLAACYGYTKIAQLILERDKTLVETATATNITPLMIANATGNTELIDVLVTYGAKQPLRQITPKEYKDLYVSISKEYHPTEEELLKHIRAFKSAKETTAAAPDYTATVETPCDTPITQEAAAPNDFATVEMRSDASAPSESAAAPDLPTCNKCATSMPYKNLACCLRCLENYCDSCIEAHKQPNKCARVCWTCKQIPNDDIMCAGCLQARYCSRECQKKDWREHKPWCLENRPEES